MNTKNNIFAGDNPFEIARQWLKEAQLSEPNDPNAIALATCDRQGMPNVRMVLLKEIEENAFVFYTNYNSQKAQEIEIANKAAFVLHWKSLRRQIRVRGDVMREDGAQADDYFASRSLQSRIGAWASHQSAPLQSRASLIKRAAQIGLEKGVNPPRPPFWGGFRITPLEIEFWADGPARLHDRFKWVRTAHIDPWSVTRLNP